MALSAQLLGNLVWADHLSVFPSAVDAIRQNPEKGITKHNSVEHMLRIICTALVDAVQKLVIRDLVTGTANVPGVFVPTPGKPGAVFVFPAAVAAAQVFAASSGWAGRDGARAAATFITSPLTRLATVGSLVMDSPFPGVGTGVGVVSPASNVGLEALVASYLTTSLKASFEGSAYFFENDDPTLGLNKTVLRSIPRYAASLAKGIASITAATTYTGPVGATTPVGPLPNTGRIL